MRHFSYFLLTCLLLSVIGCGEDPADVYIYVQEQPQQEAPAQAIEEEEPATCDTPCVTPPADQCEDQFLRLYSSEGLCKDGTCEYYSMYVFCQEGCEDGHCVEPQETEFPQCDDDYDCPGITICKDGICNKVDCGSDFDCDDKNIYTQDYCTKGKCFHNEVECTFDKMCEQGYHCHQGNCVITLQCIDDDDCIGLTMCVEGECTKISSTCNEVGCTCTDHSNCESEFCSGIKKECQIPCGPAYNFTACPQGTACFWIFDSPEGEEFDEWVCGPIICTQDIDCDDGDDYSLDKCVDSECLYFDVECTNDSMCEKGELCSLVGACYPDSSLSCYYHADCEDGDDCTTDICLVDHTCSHTDECMYGPNTIIKKCKNDADCQGSIFGDYCVYSDYGNYPEYIQISTCQPCTQSPLQGCTEDEFCYWGINLVDNLYVDKYWCGQKGEECYSDEECDDSTDNTLDKCENSQCTHISIDYKCTHPINSECDDGDPCTDDVCTLYGTCWHSANQCDPIIDETCISFDDSPYFGFSTVDYGGELIPSYETILAELNFLDKASFPDGVQIQLLTTGDFIVTNLYLEYEGYIVAEAVMNEEGLISFPAFDLPFEPISGMTKLKIKGNTSGAIVEGSVIKILLITCDGVLDGPLHVTP